MQVESLIVKTHLFSLKRAIGRQNSVGGTFKEIILTYFVLIGGPWGAVAPNESNSG